ncbi:hypothetical protein [Paenibacillus koleovorans]|uniref:hypothetical protein n=1 Tax=Paenibacillus koleovorans TaxID=121608 RepID=UPI000FDCA4C2|nr:hypothetical protein [Paenibacillus koleovorans]
MDNEMLEILKALRAGQEVLIAKFDGMDMRVSVLEGDMTALKSDMAALKGDMTVLKGDMTVLKGDMTEMRNDMAEMKEYLKIIGGKVLEQEASINVLKRAK